MKMPRFIVQFLVWFLPALVAVIVLLAFVPWALGVPGDPDAGYAEGWRLGFFALVGYLLAYIVFIVLRTVARIAGKPRLTSFAHGFVWIALAAFAGMQLLAWSKILAA